MVDCYQRLIRFIVCRKPFSRSDFAPIDGLLVEEITMSCREFMVGHLVGLEQFQTQV